MEATYPYRPVRWNHFAKYWEPDDRDESFYMVVPKEAAMMPQLPAVEPDEEDEVYLLAGYKYKIAEFRKPERDTRAMGLNLLAIADYIDTHPEVDEAQVEALAQLLLAGREPRGTDGWVELARSLVARGVRVDVKP